MPRKKKPTENGAIPPEGQIDLFSNTSPLTNEVYLEVTNALKKLETIPDTPEKREFLQHIAKILETSQGGDPAKDTGEPVSDAVIKQFMEDHKINLQMFASNPADILPRFATLLQGPGTNELVRLNSRKAKPVIDDFTGTGIIRADKLTTFIANSARQERPLRPSTWKLLDTCTVLLNQKTNYKGKVDNLLPTQVSIPLDKYAEMCGKPNTESAIKELRKKVEQDIDTLLSIQISWTEPSRKGRSRDFSKVNVFSSGSIIKGNIVVGFSPEIANYLNDSYIMQYPLDLLKVDDRNPSTYLIGRKLALHNSIDNNRRKGTSEIIGVATLLETCAFTIPSYEEVTAQRGSLSQKIITPFEKALDALADGGVIRWEYCNSKGEPLTDQQVKAFDYATFSQAYIKFEVLEAPPRVLPELPEAKPTPKKRGRPPKKKESST